MTILLNDIMMISEPELYKLHLGSRNSDFIHPLDDFVSNPASWQHWNEYKEPGKRNDWTRPRILSFIEFYHKTDAWLFGGGFQVVERREDGYALQPIMNFEKYVGRLIVSFHRYKGMRGRAFRLESFLDQFKVLEILPTVYSGESFCGFDNIAHDFRALESIFRSERADWKSALSGVNGIYLIVDKATGKKYIGSSYGEGGLWARWACYMNTGHGGNDELCAIIKKAGIEYARENFRFSILEVRGKSTPGDAIVARESHWKRALLTREHGYNAN